MTKFNDFIRNPASCILPFIATDPDVLKKFNDDLARRVMEEMGEAYDSLLSQGRVEEYAETLNQIITRNFPTENKITIDDVLSNFRNENLVESLKKIARCDDSQFLSKNFQTDENGIPILDIFSPEPLNDNIECKFGPYFPDVAPNVPGD